MPVYKYSHTCGVKDFQQFLNTDKESLVLKCAGCGAGVTARQVRDKSATIANKFGVRGVLRNGNGSN